MKKFQKFFVAVLAGALVLSMGTTLMAKGPVEKDTKEKVVNVALSVTSEQEFEVIYVGDEVELQAITPKHGSSYNDSWVVFNEDGEVSLEVDYNTLLTDVEGVNSYVSTAIFVAEEAGTYTLKYSIDMSAGKSHVVFSGDAESEEIEVRDLEEGAFITGVTVDNYVVSGQGNTFRASGDIYFTMSEGENQFAHSFSNVVLNNGNSFTNSVEIEAEGVTYTITVTRTGWSLN